MLFFRFTYTQKNWELDLLFQSELSNNWAHAYWQPCQKNKNETVKLPKAPRRSQYQFYAKCESVKHLFGTSTRSIETFSRQLHDSIIFLTEMTICFVVVNIFVDVY